MPLVKMEKWYFDMLTENKAYIFFYFAYTKVLFYYECKFTLFINNYSGLENKKLSYDVDFKKARRRVDKNGFVFQNGALSIAHPQTVIKLSADGLTVDLEYRDALKNEFEKSALPIVRHRGKHILWNPVMLKSEVSGTIDLEERELGFDRTNGYVDHLCVDYLPIKQVVKALYWGRIHHPLIDFTYTYAKPVGKGKALCRLIINMNGRVEIGESFRIDVLEWKKSDGLQIEYPLAYVLSFRSPSLRLGMKINHLVNPLESDFITDQSLKSKWRTAFFKFVTKYPKSTKFISSADISLGYGSANREIKDVPCIDEYVVFGE